MATGALSPGEIAYAAARDLQAAAERPGRAGRGHRLRPRAARGASSTTCRTTTRRRGSATTRSSSPAARSYSYFGHEDWAAHAPELKSLEGALDIRSRILAAFEAAEVEPDPERSATSWLTFVVVGGGPTGVEMAGQIAEIARDTLRGDFRAIDPTTARVLLVEAGDRVLAAFPPSLSRKATRALEELGVTPLLGHTVVDVDEGSVAIQDARRRDRAGLRAHRRSGPRGCNASPLAAELARAAGAEIDRAGRRDRRART